MNSIIGWLSGATGSGNQAKDQVNDAYQNAMKNVVSATGTGSPAATTFGDQETAALQPRFAQQQQQLAAKEAAMGITNSGAAKSDFTQLGADQSATLAGSIAPLYSAALGSYDSLNAAQPGQASSAYNNAYQNAVQNFYAGISDVGSAVAGAPPTAKTSGGNFGSGAVAPQLGTNADGTGIYDESTLADAEAAAAATANPYAASVPAPPSQYTWQNPGI